MAFTFFFEVLHYIYKLERIVKLVSFLVFPEVRELTGTIVANVNVTPLIYLSHSDISHLKLLSTPSSFTVFQ